ncbi:MAG: hypothetical protein IPP90_15410 [Gemmatimonadaceae bacterium]|nr:hypothetical protein [Gemmatimonadaceae bacterium]
MIDTDGNGRYNLLLSGHPPDATGFPFPGIAFAPGLLKNDGTGHFLSIPYIPFPNPPSGSTGTRSGAAHDFIFLNGLVYLLQLDYGGAGGMAINRVRLSDLSVTTLWEHRGAWPGSTSPCVWPWIDPTANGQIVGLSNLAEKPFDPLRCMAVSISQ